MDNIDGTKEVDSKDPSNELDAALSQKIEYLKTLQDALHQGDDWHIYELINPARYAEEIKKTTVENDVVGLPTMVGDLHADLSHYLGNRLIDYLSETHPFFYYDEVANGQFQIYFGNWWDRRLFGELDVLNVAFRFDPDEYRKLAKTFELEPLQERYNTENINVITAQNRDLQALIDNQDERDEQKEVLRQRLKELSQKNTLPWDTGKVKEERQTIVDQLTALAEDDEAALDAGQLIKANDEKILALSKEDTILNYEKQSIQQAFEDFNHFEARNESLYVDFLTSLIGQGRVTEDD